MVSIAGFDIPDDIYNSLVGVVQTTQNVFLSDPTIKTLVNILSYLPGPQAIGFQLLRDATEIINGTLNKIQDAVNQTEQKLIELEQQAQAEGSKITAVTFKAVSHNGFAEWVDNVLSNPIYRGILGLWGITLDALKTAFINIGIQALQAGANKFNSETLQLVNSQLASLGWKLNPVNVYYDYANNNYVLEFKYEALGTPAIPAVWIAIVILVIAIVILAGIVIYYEVETQKQQTIQKLPQIIAQNAQDVLANCVQTTNDVQFCEKYSEQYLSTVQNLENQAQSSSITSTASTLLTIIGIGVAGVVAIMIINALRKKE